MGNYQINLHGHCESGASIWRSPPPLAHLLSEDELHHRTPRFTYPNLNVSDDIIFSPNCIYMVDRVDVLSLKSGEVSHLC